MKHCVFYVPQSIKTSSEIDIVILNKEREVEFNLMSNSIYNDKRYPLVKLIMNRTIETINLYNGVYY